VIKKIVYYNTMSTPRRAVEKEGGQGKSIDSHAERAPVVSTLAPSRNIIERNQGAGAYGVDSRWGYHNDVARSVWYDERVVAHAVVDWHVAYDCEDEDRTPSCCSSFRRQSQATYEYDVPGRIPPYCSSFDPCRADDSYETRYPSLSSDSPAGIDARRRTVETEETDSRRKGSVLSRNDPILWRESDRRRSGLRNINEDMNEEGGHRMMYPRGVEDNDRHGVCVAHQQIDERGQEETRDVYHSTMATYAITKRDKGCYGNTTGCYDDCHTTNHAYQNKMRSITRSRVVGEEYHGNRVCDEGKKCGREQDGETGDKNDQSKASPMGDRCIKHIIYTTLRGHEDRWWRILFYLTHGATLCTLYYLTLFHPPSEVRHVTAVYGAEKARGDKPCKPFSHTVAIHLD